MHATGRQGERLLSILREHGDAGTNLAELGIGTNDKATLTGNVLEDEKILGTVHVAFGASIAIGGTVSVPIHLDCVVTEASLDDRRHEGAGRRPVRPRRLSRLNYPGADMAQTKRKRRSTKHRGNAAGIVEHRGRTSRPPEPGGAQEGRARRADEPLQPSRRPWRSAANRALVATVLFIARDRLRTSQPVQSAIALGGFMLLLYIPIGYYTDSFFYSRRQQQIAAKKGGR